jgi:predicted ATPase/transcriptional regulator with XRE-family HTH domain
MSAEGTASFGLLLRRHRRAAGLTQEALAERAGLSVEAISALERGRRRAPHRDTVQLLAVALRLTEAEAAALAGTSAPRAAPAGAVATPGPHNLTLQLTSFVGRERELAEVAGLLGSSRLLTLTGTGGTGKTRLALEVAAALLGHYPQGVWLAELAPLADPAGVAPVVAAAVGVHGEAGQPLLATLLAALRSRRLLLVLDNCEHLLEACATLVEALLRGCPQVTILSTSREALGLAGETTWRVPSLALPAAQPLPVLDVLAQVEAARLFVERARAVQPHFALTAANAPIVAQICRRLDGIPLALELAAARLRGLAIEELADRLDQRFRLLTGGSRTALPRQQTLQATVDWSYGLLSAPEQALFNRLSVFSGGFTPRAAEGVCASGEVAPEAVLDLLLRLVDRSLVSVEEQEGNVTRYRLLETLRQYGRERLLAAGEPSDLAARHAAHYRALADANPDDVSEAEHLNIRQALRWALDVGDAQEGMRLVRALQCYWHNHGYMAEGLQLLAELLAQPGAAARTPARAATLFGLANLRRSTRLLMGSQAVAAETHALAVEAISIARETGDKLVLADALTHLGGWVGREDYPRGRALLEEALHVTREAGLLGDELFTLNRLGDLAWEQGDRAAAHGWWSVALGLARQGGNRGESASQLGDLGMMAFHEGDYATARSQVAESLALFRADHVHFGIALALGWLGAVARAQGDCALARSCYGEKLAFWERIGDRTGIASTLAELGALAQQEGDYRQAQALFEEAQTLLRELGDNAGGAGALAHLGNLACEQGDVERAAIQYREALALLGAADDGVVAALCLEGLAAVATLQGRPERAARLYGAAATQRRGTFVLNVWDDRVARDRQLARVRAALGETAWTAAWKAGQALTLEGAVALARQELPPVRDSVMHTT